MKRKVTIPGILAVAALAWVGGMVAFPKQTASIIARVKGLLSGAVGQGGRSDANAELSSTGQQGLSAGGYDPYVYPTDASDPQVDMDALAYSYRAAGTSYETFVSLTNHYVGAWVPQARWDALDSIMDGYLSAGVLTDKPEPNPAALAYSG